jgi:hypothetical protein
MRAAVASDPESRLRLVAAYLNRSQEMCSRVVQWFGRYVDLDDASRRLVVEVVRGVEFTMVCEAVAGSDEHLADWEASLRTRSYVALSAFVTLPSTRHQRAVAQHRQRLDSARQDPQRGEGGIR